LDREVTHSRNGNPDSAHRGEAKPFSAAVGAEVPRFGKYRFANGLAILVIDDAKLVASMGADEPSDFEIRRSREG